MGTRTDAGTEELGPGGLSALWWHCTNYHNNPGRWCVYIVQRKGGALVGVSAVSAAVISDGKASKASGLVFSRSVNTHTQTRKEGFACYKPDLYAEGFAIPIGPLIFCVMSTAHNSSALYTPTQGFLGSPHW